MVVNQYAQQQYNDGSAHTTNQNTHQMIKGAQTPTRQLNVNKYTRDGVKPHNTQDPSSPMQLLESQETFQNKKQAYKDAKLNGQTNQTMHNYIQQIGDSPQKLDDHVPLTPVVVSQKRKNGNLSLQNRQDKPKMFSSQNVDELKSIDEYKAQISSQIRIQNNQHAAISARNDITAGRSQTQVKNQIDFQGLVQSPDISNFTSPIQPRDFQTNSFNQQQIAQYQTGNQPQEANHSFLPNIEQKVQNTDTNSNLNSQNNSQIRSPSKLIQQLTKKTEENWNNDDYGIGKESADGTQGRAGSRLMMQNNKQNNQVLRTLQQHVTQRQQNNTTAPNQVQTPKTGPGGQYNNQQLLALAQMQQQNAVQQLLNTSANGLKNLRQNFNQSQHIIQSNFQLSPHKQIKDQQLEGLNETLQRLAREKAQGRPQNMNKKTKSLKPDKNNQRMLNEAYPIQSQMGNGQNNLSFMHPQLQMEQTLKKQKDPYSPGQKKKSKVSREKGLTPQTLDNLKQKLEAQNRNQLMMNDSLNAVRLQGNTQKNINAMRMTNTQLTAQPQGIDGTSMPYAIHTDTRSFIDDINSAVTKIKQPINQQRLANNPQNMAHQLQIKSKSFDPNSTQNVIYKLNMSQIKLKDSNTLIQNNQNIHIKPIQEQLHELSPSQLSQYHKNYNYGNMGGHIPQELLIPDNDFQIQSMSNGAQTGFRQSMQSDLSRSRDFEVNKSLNKLQAKKEDNQNAYSPSVAATVLQRLQLNTNNQFGSVVEDVEMEQQNSPSPNYMQDDRAGRLRVDQVKQYTVDDDTGAPQQPGQQQNIKSSPKNNAEPKQMGASELKHQGLKLKLIGMDQSNKNAYHKQTRKGNQKPSAPEPTQDDDVYTRIVNKINIIIENKKSIEHSKEQLNESIEKTQEQDDQNNNQSKSHRRYSKSPQHAISQINEKYNESVMLVPDHSNSTHSKRYKSHSRARDDKSDIIQQQTQTQESNNNINVKNIRKQKDDFQGKNLVVQDIDISPQYQLNTVVSPSQTSKASSASEGSLNRIQLQNIEQAHYEKTIDDASQNDNQQQETENSNLRQVQKHQTQQMYSKLSNASEDQGQTVSKKFELPTIESIKMQKGQLSDNGSQARRYKSTQKEEIGGGRQSQQQIVKIKAPKGPSALTRNQGHLIPGNKTQKEQNQQQQGQISSRSRRPPVAQNKNPSPLKMTDRRKRGGGQSSMVNNQKNQNIVRQPSVVSIEGYESSETPEAYNNIQLGQRIPREGKTFCNEYIQHRGCQNLPKNVRHLFTPRAFKHGDGSFSWSNRLFMSKECAISEERRMLPILIVNLDGAMGYWDDQRKNYYLLRPKVVDGLAQLSYDFRIVAVSSQKKKLINKLIYGLINIPADFHGYEGSSSSKGIVFDAVYQLATENEDNKFRSFRKNIDEIHFDLSQVLLDMQFSKHRPPASTPLSQTFGMLTPTTPHEQFQTFWQTESYRPFKKVIILTTHTYHHNGTCYSYDYNYLFQASKFKHEASKKAPIVIQLPHMRTQPRLTFESTLQLIFTIQSVAYSIACGKQPQAKKFEGELHHNPDFSSFEICKKYLCSKWRLLDGKMKKSSVVKGLRIYDQKDDPFVDLELLDFNESYKFLKKYYKEGQRQSDWLKLKKYYLLVKPQEKKLSPLKMKQNLKVTFNESPEIRRIGEERDKAIVTTQDSSKSDKLTAVKAGFISEDAKNAYNGLMIRNFKMQQEVNGYARYFRIQNQRKIVMKQKLEQDMQAQEEAEDPIVIFDGDKEKKKSALRSSFKKSQKKEHEQSAPPKKVKEYAMKYRVLKIRPGEEPDENSFIDMTRYQAINLRSKFSYMMSSIKNPGAEKQLGGSTSMGHIPGFTAAEQTNFIQSHTSKEIVESTDKRNYLIELLSKRQNKIQYSTNQDIHLKNNLNQLVNGEQQYKEQQKYLNEAERLVKENEPEFTGRKDKKEGQIDYLDNL